MATKMDTTNPSAGAQRFSNFPNGLRGPQLDTMIRTLPPTPQTPFESLPPEFLGKARCSTGELARPSTCGVQWQALPVLPTSSSSEPERPPSLHFLSGALFHNAA